jgi:uncharacterized protein YbaR (Trm112 family)
MSQSLTVGPTSDLRPVGPSLPPSSRSYRCPRCHVARLELDDNSLRCRYCNCSYPVVNGVPILINADNSVFAIEDYLPKPEVTHSNNATTTGRASGLRAAYLRVAHALSEARVVSLPFHLDKILAAIAEDIGARPRVLVIGSGEDRYKEPADFVYTDVAYSDGLDAIADAHDLPFADAEFDFVLAISVLEHVADPQRAVDEIWRVLRPRGCVYASTPFLQPVHMGAYDFTRFTYLGHRRLFRRFADIESGMGLGPGKVLAWSVQSLLANLANGKTYRSAARLVSLLITLPVLYLDVLARNKPGAIDGAGSVFFYGRKQEIAISDRELVALYRGGIKHKSGSLYWTDKLGGEKGESRPIRV